MKEGDRIGDAIKEAGGLTEKADISDINLAYIVDDGSKIVIPSILDGKETEQDKEIENESNTTVNKKININKATEEELQSLPGIGFSIALRIVEFRNKNGKFQKIEDIKNVNGIGENKFEQIKENISVR